MIAVNPTYVALSVDNPLETLKHSRKIRLIEFRTYTGVKERAEESHCVVNTPAAKVPMGLLNASLTTYVWSRPVFPDPYYKGPPLALLSKLGACGARP